LQGALEVDLVVETNGRLIPIEVKASATPNPGMASGIAAFRRELGAKAAKGFVVHTGRELLPLTSDAVAVPFGRL